MSRFIALFVLVGCQSEPVVVAPPRRVEPIVEVPTPAPAVVFPPYDESLDSPEEVAAWQADAIAKVDAYAALPDPEKIRAKYEAYFKVSAKVDPQPLGDARVWDAPTQKTRAEAVALEANDEEYEAGRAFVALGDNESARRCAKKLEEEGETKAVGKLSFLIGDKIDPEHPVSYDWTVGVPDIFLLAKVDKPRAIDLAKVALGSEYFNSVVVFSEGEGCSAYPVPGTLEIYQLVKSEPALKEAYLDDVRRWTTANPSDVDVVDYAVSWCGLKDLGALLSKVRKLNDADLIGAWNDALRPMSAEYEGMTNGYRAILGLPAISAGNDPIATGTLSPANLKKLQAEFKIGNAGSPEAIRAAIVDRIEAKFDAVIEPKDEAGVALSNAMFVAINALWTNAEADRARKEDGSEAPRHVVPSTQEQLAAIMAPVKAELAAKGIPDFEPYVTTGP